MAKSTTTIEPCITLECLYPSLHDNNLTWIQNNNGNYSVDGGQGVILAPGFGLDDGFGSVYVEFKKGLFHYEEPRVVVVVCLYVIVFVSALLGNLISLVVLLNRHYTRCSTDYFLINMAVSDLLVALVCIPVTVARNVYEAWVFGQFMCKAVFYLQGVAVTASVWTISCLSMDRFIAIKHPMLARHIRSSLYIKIAVACVWIISLTVMIPIAIVRYLDIIDVFPTDPIYYCNENWTNKTGQKAYAVFFLVFIYVVPGVLMTVMYGAMGRKLWQSGEAMHRQASKACNTSRVISERRRVARMSVMVAVIFTLCWLPYYIISTLMDLVPTDQSQNIRLGALFYSLLLGHTNCAVNPILYCFIGKRFRIQLVHTLRHGCCKPTHQSKNSFTHGRYASHKLRQANNNHREHSSTGDVGSNHSNSTNKKRDMHHNAYDDNKLSQRPLLSPTANSNHHCPANGNSSGHSDVTLELISSPQSPQDHVSIHLIPSAHTRFIHVNGKDTAVV